MNAPDPLATRFDQNNARQSLNNYGSGSSDRPVQRRRTVQVPQGSSGRSKPQTQRQERAPREPKLDAHERWLTKNIGKVINIGATDGDEVLLVLREFDKFTLIGDAVKPDTQKIEAPDIVIFKSQIGVMLPAGHVEEDGTIVLNKRN